MLDILMITHRRPGYTARALSRLLDSCDDRMRVWVWHNGTDQETRNVVRALSSHRAFYKLHESEENKKLYEPTNWLWQNGDGRYVSKVDDDCLLPDGWGGTLLDAHERNENLGAIGCWRFYEEDFVPEVAEKKLSTIRGGHRLLRNCWVQGSGYVMKRACIEDLGLLSKESFSNYCIRLALRGWENGWYFPFIHEEHMDDPRSEFCEIRTDEEFTRSRPLSAVNDNVVTLEEWRRRVRHMAYLAQVASPDPRQHSGWRRRASNLTNRLKRLAGVREPWRVIQQNIPPSQTPRAN